MKHLPLGMLLIAILALLPAAAQPEASPSDPLPETKEMIVDLFGDELRLYLGLPDNYLVFVDKDKSSRNVVAIGPDERHNLMTAYMTASGRAATIKDDVQDEGFSITVRDCQVNFKTARKETRSWVVLYVTGPDQTVTRFAIPQQWDLKDPKYKELYGIKSGFEHLLIKTGL